MSSRSATRSRPCSSDYKAAFLNTLGANAEFYGKFTDNAPRLAQEDVGRDALSQPCPGQAGGASQDVYITIQKETDAGIVVAMALAAVLAPFCSGVLVRHFNRKLPVSYRDQLQIDRPGPRRGIQSPSSSRTDRYWCSRSHIHRAPYRSPSCRAFGSIRRHPSE
jgi:hypothetical protein